MAIITVGIDLAKNVFAVHGVDETGKPALVRPEVTRAKLLPLIANLPSCLIGMEACSGAHLWSREFSKFGHIHLQPNCWSIFFADGLLQSQGSRMGRSSTIYPGPDPSCGSGVLGGHRWGNSGSHQGNLTERQFCITEMIKTPEVRIKVKHAQVQLR